MRLILLFALFSILALGIETALPQLIPFHAIVPNLIVILAVDLGLRHHGATAALIAFAIGYATDALAGAHLGLNALMVTAVFLLSYEISIRLMVPNAAIGAIIVLFAAPATALGSIAIAAGVRAMGQTGPMIPGLAVNAVVSALAAPLVFAITARCKRAIGLPAAAARE